MHTGSLCSARCRKRRVRPLLCCKLNRDSTDSMTTDHSYAQVHRSPHHSRCSCLWCNVNGSQSYDLYLTGHAAEKFVHACFVNNTISLLRDHEVTAWSLKFIRVRYLSSRLVVYLATEIEDDVPHDTPARNNFVFWAQSYDIYGSELRYCVIIHRSPRRIQCDFY